FYFLHSSRKVRKNIAKGVGEKGHKVIHFKEAFHGRSGYTLSLTNTDPKKTMYFPKFEWPRIINPKLSFVNGKVPEDVLKKVIETEKLAVEQIEKAVKEHQDDIAAVSLLVLVCLLVVYIFFFFGNSN